jgi:hypothetical protein
MVGSVISATKAGTPPVPSGAAKAELYMPNASNPRTTLGHEASLSWLEGEGVHTVNESHENGDPNIADAFAYMLDMTIVKAAGDSNGSEEVAKCYANDICVGPNHDSVWGISCFSRDLNDDSSTPDKEEPDVIAFGGQRDTPDSICEVPYAGFGTQVHGFSSTSDWSGEEASTSYAAASVTSMIAHVRNACEPLYGSTMEPMFLRALVRAAAWENVTEEDYATPSDTHDYRDGGGWLGADALEVYCNGTTGGIFSEPFSGQLTDDGATPPVGTTIYTPGQPHVQDYHKAEDTSYPRKWVLAWQQTLYTGDRVRFSASWDMCNTGGSTYLGVDFDLFLYNANPGNGKFVYGSQSNDDNHEGFDIRISENDPQGVYQLWITWPSGDEQNCGASAAWSMWVVGRVGSAPAQW